MIEEIKNRISVFIDGSNLHHAQMANGWKIRFSKLKQFLETKGVIKGLYYFTPTPPFYKTEIVRGYRKFKKMLILTGYQVIERELKEIKYKDKDGQIKTKPKANLDAEMLSYLLNTSKDYDELVIIAGDSDFVPVLKNIVLQGKIITCIANENNTSLEMRNTAHTFIDLGKLKKELC